MGSLLAFDALNEAGGGRRIGFEGWNGFDEPRHRECVANAAVAADKMERATFAGELNRAANERRDAGAVDLRDAVEVNDDFAASALNDGLEDFGKLLARLTYRETAVDYERVDAVVFADSDFHGQTFGHGQVSLTDYFATALSKNEKAQDCP
jgi:hypothetical protein